MKYATRGANDEVTTCSCCGRNGLKKTVILEVLDADSNGTGLIERFGVDCAAKATGWKKSNIERKILDAQYAEFTAAYKSGTREQRMAYDVAASKDYMNTMTFDTKMSFFR